MCANRAALPRNAMRHRQRIVVNRSWSDMPTSVRVFALVSAALELVAIFGTLFLLGEGMRRVMLALGGFWPELLSGAPGIYPGQAITMFATSAVLHGGPLHLFMNMVGLMWLAPMITERIGERAFWPIAGLSALGAGLGFTILSESLLPMVGASGVIFGLLGVVAYWELRDRLRARTGLRLLAEQAAVFVALNLALMFLAGGSIAWQAHLGGFLAGLACGHVTWPDPRRTRRA